VSPLCGGFETDLARIKVTTDETSALLCESAFFPLAPRFGLFGDTRLRNRLLFSIQWLGVPQGLDQVFSLPSHPEKFSGPDSSNERVGIDPD
jgi:hypothetical protein